MEKTFNQIISEKEVEIEEKFENWMTEQSKSFAKRIFKHCKDTNYSEEEMAKELKFKIDNKEFRVHTTSLISGLLFIVLGYFIFSGTLFVFNQYVGTSSFQKWIFSIEDKLLNFVK